MKGIQADCDGGMSEAISTLVRSTVSIGENEGLGFSIYPNPTTGKLNLSINTNGSNVVNLTVYNVLGNAVYTEKDVTVYNKLTKVIDLSNLPRVSIT